MPTVLVVEDYAPLQMLYHRALSGVGYTVVLAASCREAIECLHELKPDVVLLDMSLPDGDGLSVIQSLAPSARMRSTQFVVVTGHDQYQQLAEVHGIEYFLYKPVSVPMLLTLVDRLTCGGQITPPPQSFCQAVHW
jgi:CheY-like chemotaxis protein